MSHPERDTLVERARSGISGSGADSVSCFVPGRIEFLGKHTDYAGGRSLVCATERGIGFAGRLRSDTRLIIRDTERSLEAAIDFADAVTPADGAWSRYAAVVGRRLARNFSPLLRGADIGFASNLPPSAGLSSSSALVAGFFHVLSRLNRLSEHPAYRAEVVSMERMAEYLGAVENGSSYRSLDGETGVGTLGGCQDHAAMLLGRENALLQCAFGPLRQEAVVALSPDLIFVIAVSGVAAEKTGSVLPAYNRIARATGRMLARWNQVTGRQDATLLAGVRDHPDGHDRLRQVIADIQEPDLDHHTLLSRLEQVVMETTVIIPDTAEAFRRNDLTAVGLQVDLSQLLAERLLRNQVPETIELARSARALGAVAASAFGAGFGGSVYALVRSGDAEGFLTRWRSEYLDRFPHRREGAEFFTTRAAAAASWVMPS